MASQRGQFGGRLLWGEEFEGVTMLPVMGGGVKAGEAGCVLAFWGCMPEDAGDELAGVQGEVFAFGIAVVEIGEGHGVLREVQAAVAAQGAALDVSGQVQRDAAAVGIGLVDLDVPVGVPLLVDQGAQLLGILVCWQAKALVGQGELQG